MTPTRRYAKKQTKAINRRRQGAQERHQRQQRQAQRDIEALRQALYDLGLPDNLVIEIEGLSLLKIPSGSSLAASSSWVEPKSHCKTRPPAY